MIGHLMLYRWLWWAGYIYRMEQSLNNIYEASDEDLHAVVWGEEKLDYAHEDAGLYPLIEGKESE